MSQHIQVITTTDRKDDALKITKSLVEERLAACAQVLGPITSSYWWEDSVETAEEWICFIKTRSDLYPDLERRIKTLHSYSVPEIIATPITMGNPDYLDWLQAQTMQAQHGDRKKQK